MCVYLRWRHDVLLGVFFSNVFWFYAVICYDDLYVGIETPDATQQHLELSVAQECLCGNGDVRADIWKTESYNKQ